jgi:hypothetical protein
MSSTASNNLSAAVAAVASAALTQATISQMNSINEIPINEMIVDGSLPPVAATLVTTNQESSSQQQEANNITDNTSTASQMLPPQQAPKQQSNVTMPISIPSKGTSLQKPHAIGQHETLSVPGDLCSTSMTSVSPNCGTNTNNSLLATSIESDMCNSVTDKSNISSSMSSTSGTPGKKKLTRCVLESCKRKVGLTGKLKLKQSKKKIELFDFIHFNC